MENRTALVAGGVFVGIVALLVLIFAGMSATTINPGEEGVEVLFGQVKDAPLASGFYWVNPLAHVEHIDIQTAKEQVDANASSSDLQTVDVTVALNYHVNPDAAISIYKDISGGLKGTIIAPAIQEAVKATTAQFTAEELITKRDAVSAQIQSLLADRLSKYATVEKVNIVNFGFSTSFNDAVEAKVTAQQNALAAQNKLAQIQFEAQQTVVTAKAQADALAIKGAAITANPGVVQLNAIDKWDGVLPSYVGATIPFLNIK